MLWAGVVIVAVFTAGAALYLWHDRRAPADAGARQTEKPATAPVGVP